MRSDDYIPSSKFTGELQGFVFKTCGHGTGYYKDRAACDVQRRVLVLADLVAHASSTPTALPWNTTHQAMPSRARRARLPDGRRKRIISRKKRAILRSSHPPAQCLPTGLVEERWWPKRGLWAIDTANGNSWNTLAPAMLSRSQADVLLAQETKIISHDKLRSAESEARRLGWNPVLSAAHRTAAAMGTGGGAVLTRKGSGITDLTNALIQEGMRHRICISWVDAVIRGGVYCVSLWLRHSEGLSPANMAILDELAVALGILDGPWIIGGDWNLTPEILTASRWPQIVGGAVAATSLVTCNSSTYDFFVVARTLSHAVVGVQRLEDGGMNPHWAARLILRGDARRFAVRRLVKPPRVEGSLPMGPQPVPPSYAETERFAGDPATLDNAVEEWYTNARKEWSSLAGYSLAHRKPRFRWMSAVGKLAKPWVGSTKLSVMWRSLARRAQDVARLVAEGVHMLPHIKHQVLCGHLSASSIAARSVCIGVRAETERQVSSWAVSLRSAVAAASQHWICSLATHAYARAKKLEAATSKLRASQWRAHIGASSSPSGAPASPTKFAYRWVRGLTGWQHSPIGCGHENDAIPSEPLEDDLDDQSTEVISIAKPSQRRTQGGSSF